MDTDLIKQCADDRLAPAIVEKFVEAVETDPLSVKVTVDGKAVLLPRIENAIQAADVLANHVGKAEIRFGVVQASAADFRLAEIGEYLFDPCTNLQIGSKQFAEIYEKFGGRNTDEAASIAEATSEYLRLDDIPTARDEGGVDFATPQRSNDADPNRADIRVSIEPLNDESRSPMAE